MRVGKIRLYYKNGKREVYEVGKEHIRAISIREEIIRIYIRYNIKNVYKSDLNGYECNFS